MANMPRRKKIFIIILMWQVRKLSVRHLKGHRWKQVTCLESDGLGSEPQPCYLGPVIYIPQQEGSSV